MTKPGSHLYIFREKIIASNCRSMRTNKTTICLCAAASLLTVNSGLGQGFIDLDFEDAVIIRDPSLPYYPDSAYAASAVPGWAVYGSVIGTNAIFYNFISLGVAAVSIHDNASLLAPLQGSYTMLLQPDSVTHAPVAIGQSGQVPNDAQFVTFYGESSFNIVTFAGNPISLSVLGSTPNYTIYGGNISPYSGQVGELLIQGVGRIDNIQFAVPEPTTMSILGLGLLGLLWHQRMKIGLLRKDGQ
jgi:hypothetical protein